MNTATHPVLSEAREVFPPLRVGAWCCWQWAWTKAASQASSKHTAILLAAGQTFLSGCPPHFSDPGSPSLQKGENWEIKLVVFLRVILRLSEISFLMFICWIYFIPLSKKLFESVKSALAGLSVHESLMEALVFKLSCQGPICTLSLDVIPTMGKIGAQAAITEVICSTLVPRK